MPKRGTLAIIDSHDKTFDIKLSRSEVEVKDILLDRVQNAVGGAGTLKVINNKIHLSA